MKNINKLQKIIFIIIIALIIAMGIYVLTIFIPNKKANTKIDKEETIKYDYIVYKRDSSLYKETFKDLKKVLDASEIDYNKYVELISKMFIIDFYTLDNKLTNLNIGGVDFVHSSIVSNFKEKAKDTMYKYVESNVYGDRKQELPVVSSVNVDDITQKSFKYGKNIDSKAYYVKVSWSYKKDLGYETSKTLVFGHEDKKLALLQML